MPVEVNDPWKKRKFWKRERKHIYDKAFEDEKQKQLKLKRERRVKQIQEKAKAKAHRKYGMSKREKAVHVIQKINNGVAKARKEVESLQEDLENDLRNEGYF